MPLTFTGVASVSRSPANWTCAALGTKSVGGVAVAASIFVLCAGRSGARVASRARGWLASALVRVDRKTVARGGWRPRRWRHRGRNLRSDLTGCCLLLQRANGERGTVSHDAQHCWLRTERYTASSNELKAPSEPE